MRAVIQRVKRACVDLPDKGTTAGSIEVGLCVLLCAMEGDSIADADFMAHKIATLRVFQDADGKMNLNVAQVQGEVLLVSQFTLAADTTSGTRPSFSQALEPVSAQRLVSAVRASLDSKGIVVASGEFAARMLVKIENDGPVTILIDSQSKK